MFKSIPIRFSIISNIAIVTLIGVGLVISVQIYYSNKLAISAANSLFTKISQDVNMRMADFDDHIRHTIEFLEDFPGIL